jgi:glutamyl-tRNA synthetase
VSGSDVKVRFAPSPTGMVHIGNIRVAIFNWLFAKKHGGKFLVRIEDTDLERSTEQYKDVILDALSWMNIEPDGPIVLQSKNLDKHNKLLNKLLEEDKVYKCFCSDKKDLETGSFSKYSGSCRENQDQEGSFVIRFKLPENLPDSLEFEDLVHGKISIPSDQLDDFIIVRSDGSPTYNFAVVADDIDMGITHVIRGDDHLMNTYKQKFIYDALGAKAPEFAHLPMILNEQGAKLSKRDAVVAVAEYKSSGYLPDALFNYLVRLGWSSGDQEIFTKEELIKLFDLKNVQKSGAAFDKNKLNWLNGVYLRDKDSGQLLSLIMADLKQSLFDKDQLVALIDLYKERSITLKDLSKQLNALAINPDNYNPEFMKKWILPETKAYLADLKDLLSKESGWGQEEITAVIKNYSKEKGLKLGQLAQPLRLAITGGTESPSIFALLGLLGKEETVSRLENILSVI